MNKKTAFSLLLLSLLFALVAYKLTTPFERQTFKATELPGQLGAPNNGSKDVNASKKEGYLSYGPYVNLPAGTYRFDIAYTSQDARGSKYDIATDAGKTILASQELQPTLSKGRALQTLANEKDAIYEVRVWYAAQGSLSLHSITITKEFGYLELKRYLLYLLIALLLNALILFAHRYSKKITYLSLLLIATIIASYALKAYSDYYNYKEASYKEMPLSYKLFSHYLKESIKSEAIKLTAPQLQADANIESFYVMVDQKDLDALNADLPASGMEQTVDARLKINDSDTMKVKLRYRGGSSWNWQYDRKSIKIKLAKTDSYNMMKTINFSVLYSQDMLIEPITQRVAAEFGLLAPEVKTVRMFINGVYEGLYLYLDQVDESFLRKHKIMPGSIYYGDYSPGEDKTKNVTPQGIAKLWYDSALWKKKASRNAEQKANREDIDLLIHAINHYDDEEFYEFAQTYLGEEYYAYLALDVLWGTHHHDYFHNHKIYFDPYRGKFIPISWDVRFYRDDKNKDNSYYPLIERLATNPILEAKRDKALHKILQTLDADYVAALMQKEKETFMSSYLADKNRKKIIIDQNLFPYEQAMRTPQLVAATQEDVDAIFQTYLDVLKSRIAYLKELLDDATILYEIEEMGKTTRIRLEVDGNSPLILDYNAATLYPDRKIINANALGLDAYAYGTTHIQSAPRRYAFEIPTSDFDPSLFVAATNAITLKRVPLAPARFERPFEPSHPLPPLASQATSAPLTLSGTIHVTKTRVYDKNTPITIEPNTTFIMDANASLYFYAKVTALGTKDKPIKFIAKDKAAPWGLVAIQGKATAQSRLHHCHFEHGSIDTKNLIHYTAMLNIHDTDHFEVKNCFIGENHIGDDAMHIAYATGTVEGCVFDGARSDGLDIDIADVNITNSTFKNSGNDTLDIMTTTLVATNNTFTNAGDKGISIGESSNATITNAAFTQTLIGVAIKDASQATLSRVSFVDSKQGDIELYNKNKRYPKGGTLDYYHTPGAKLPNISADKRSTVNVIER